MAAEREEGGGDEDDHREDDNLWHAKGRKDAMNSITDPQGDIGDERGRKDGHRKAVPHEQQDGADQPADDADGEGDGHPGRISGHDGGLLEGQHAVVIGRSPILGKPMAMMLLQANATVTICHSRTRDLDKLVRQADIVVGAVGRPEFIKAEWIKDAAVVVDAGYHPGGVGDIDLGHLKSRVSAYTPVPGGVGPMTINTLIMQTVESAEKTQV